jgi:hypothetical protein
MGHTAAEGPLASTAKGPGCVGINQQIPITLEETQHTVARILEDE